MASECQQCNCKYCTAATHKQSDFSQGAICLDTIGSAWSPVLTIKSALLSLQSLLSTPEPKDPQDAQVAKMLMTNPAEFERTAREWAIKHAGAPASTKWSRSATQSSSKSSHQKESSREDELKRELARYEGRSVTYWSQLTIIIDIKATTGTSLIGS